MVHNFEKLDEQIKLKVSRWSKCEITPICSFIGGIASQEVIKKTGKYIRINQRLWLDFSETTENIKEDVDRNLQGSSYDKYDEQIAIYGKEFQKKLNNLNIFIIGTGALESQLLKIFPLMGISTEKIKKLW